MRRPSVYCGCLIVLMVAICSTCASAQTAVSTAPPITANLIVSATAAPGDKVPVTVTPSAGAKPAASPNSVFNGHYYRSSNGMIREDSENGWVVIDPKAGTVTIVNINKKQATSIQASSATSQQLPLAPESLAKGSLAVTGNDTLEGHPIVKSASPDGTHEVWRATDLRLQVYMRSVGEGRSVVRSLRNIAVQEPDPSVFAVPAGYAVVNQALPLTPPPGPPPAHTPTAPNN